MRSYISLLQKQMILQDLDSGVSRKTILNQYGLKNYSNIYRIMKMRDKLMQVDNEMETNEVDSDSMPNEENYFLDFVQVKMQAKLLENIFAASKNRLSAVNETMDSLETAIDEKIE